MEELACSRLPERKQALRRTWSAEEAVNAPNEFRTCLSRPP